VASLAELLAPIRRYYNNQISGGFAFLQSAMPYPNDITDQDRLAPINKAPYDTVIVNGGVAPFYL